MYIFPIYYICPNALSPAQFRQRKLTFPRLGKSGKSQLCSHLLLHIRQFLPPLTHSFPDHSSATHSLSFSLVLMWKSAEKADAEEWVGVCVCFSLHFTLHKFPSEAFPSVFVFLFFSRRQQTFHRNWRRFPFSLPPRLDSPGLLEASLVWIVLEECRSKTRAIKADEMVMRLKLMNK